MNSETKKEVNGGLEEKFVSLLHKLEKKQEEQMEELKRKQRQMEEFLSKVVERVLPKVEELLIRHSPPPNNDRNPLSPTGNPKKESLGSEEEFGARLQQLERKQQQEIDELKRKQRHTEEEQQRKMQQMEERFAKMEEFLSKVLESVLPKVEELLACHSPPSTTAPQSEKESPASTRAFAPTISTPSSSSSSVLTVSTSKPSSSTHTFASTISTPPSSDLIVPACKPSSSVPSTHQSSSVPLATASNQTTSTSTIATQSLHEAAETGDVQSLLRILAEGKKVDSRDARGNTALHVAARRGHLAVVEALVQGGARVDVRSATRSRPLHMAAAWGHVHVVRRLVELGAAVIHCDDQWYTPLSLAAARGQTAALEALLQSSVEPEELERCLEDAGSADVVRVLLNDARLSVDENLARKAVNVAASNGRLGALEALLQKGFRSSTALHCAAFGSHTACLQVLLDAGADIGATNDNEWTALHCAARKGETQCLRLLIDAGSDVNASFGNGTPLKLAVDYEHHDTARILRENGGRYT